VRGLKKKGGERGGALFSASVSLCNNVDICTVGYVFCCGIWWRGLEKGKKRKKRKKKGEYGAKCTD